MNIINYDKWDRMDLIDSVEEQLEKINIEVEKLVERIILYTTLRDSSLLNELLGLSPEEFKNWYDCKKDYLEILGERVNKETG